jgi:hypothetical protein
MLKYIMAASIHFAQITKKQDLLPNKQQQCYGIQLSSISKNAGPSGTVLQAMRPRRIATEQDNGSSALHSLFASSFSLAAAKRLSLAACANVDGLQQT